MPDGSPRIGAAAFKIGDAHFLTEHDPREYKPVPYTGPIIPGIWITVPLERVERTSKQEPDQA